MTRKECENCYYCRGVDKCGRYEDGVPMLDITNSDDTCGEFIEKEFKNDD